MKNSLLVSCLSAFGLSLLASTASAQQYLSNDGHWEYSDLHSHGMATCAFESFSGGRATPLDNPSPRTIVLHPKAGIPVELRLFCVRAQTPVQGGVLMGPEVNYSGPNGPGRSVGVDRSTDIPATGRPQPKGRSWLVAGAAAQYTLVGGNEQLSITIAPVAPSVSQAQFTPVQQKVDNLAAQSNDEPWKARKIQIGLGFSHGLDEHPFGKHSRNGVNALIEGYPLGSSDGQWKLSIGAQLTWQARFKPIISPTGVDFNVQDGGRYADWHSTYIPMSVGANFQPNQYFSANFRGLLGPMIFTDSNNVNSQLKDRTNIFGPGQTEVVGAIGAGIDLGVHFGPVRFSTGLQMIQTLGKVEVNRLPENRCTAVGTNVACLQSEQGHIFDFNWTVIQLSVQQ